MDKSVSKPVHKPEVTNQITSEDKTIVKLMSDKDMEIKKGRALSAEIDDVQKQIDELTKEEYELTSKVEPEALIKLGDELKEEINAKIKELEEVANDIKKAKLAAIPKDMEEKHLKLNSQREKLEQKRNKVALKVQKIKDRMVPKLQKLAKPKLNEFEDLLSAELKDGKVVIEVFNHRAEWEKQWREKNVI